MNIDINGVKITLTQEQLKQIVEQTSKIKTIEEINSYEDACKVLSEKVEQNPSIWKKINTITRAMNFIENGFKSWKPDFENNNQKKYYPLHETNNSGLVFYGSVFDYHSASGLVAFLKTEKASNLLGTKFIGLYKEIQETY